MYYFILRAVDTVRAVTAKSPLTEKGTVFVQTHHKLPVSVNYPRYLTPVNVNNKTLPIIQETDPDS